MLMLIGALGTAQGGCKGLTGAFRDFKGFLFFFAFYMEARLSVSWGVSERVRCGVYCSPYPPSRVEPGPFIAITQ